MRKTWKKGTALVLAAALCAAALGGCSKKDQTVEAKPVYSLNGESVDADLTTFLLRYNQAQIDEAYGVMMSNYYGQSIWTMDLSGSGMNYELTFKAEFADELQRLMLAEEHAKDYGVEVTDEEKAAIQKAAAEFMSSNDEETLAAMNATQETVEKALTLYTIRAKEQKEMTKDVDTEVSDDEAAQTSVSYIQFMPTVESEAEDFSVELTTEAETEADGAQTEAETAAFETEEEDKTSSADETEALFQTEAETEDPEMAIAREKYYAMAQDALDRIQDGEDFDTVASEVQALGTAGVYVSTFTYGKDAEYPEAEIRDAVEGLQDGEVADSIVESEDSFYILHMDAVLDEEATQERKDEIVEERKQTAIDMVYATWMQDETWDTDTEALALIAMTDRVYNAPEVPDTEALTEAGTEAEAIAETEADIAAQTEAENIAQTEAE